MIIKNVSDNDINIDENILLPGKTMKIENIDISVLLNRGYLEIVEESKKVLNKESLIESLFNLHLFDCSSDDIDILKSFYIDSVMGTLVSSNTINLLSESKNKEDFLEVLLNNFYPDLINKR